MCFWGFGQCFCRRYKILYVGTEVVLCIYNSSGIRWDQLDLNFCWFKIVCPVLVTVRITYHVWCMVYFSCFLVHFYFCYRYSNIPFEKIRINPQSINKPDWKIVTFCNEVEVSGWAECNKKNPIIRQLTAYNPMKKKKYLFTKRTPVIALSQNCQLINRNVEKIELFSRKRTLLREKCHKRYKNIHAWAIKTKKMDASCIFLTFMLLIQMAMILIMLNPVYDVRKLTQFITSATKGHRVCYFCTVTSYFVSVVYLGMYIPLQNIHKLIFSKVLNEYEKLILLNRIEKNYIIAGFSLFLVVVMYGVRALLSYSASLVEITDRQSDTLMVHSDSKLEKKVFGLSENILPNLLRVKRSISYETILFTNELREQLKAVIRNVDFPHNRCTLSSILETSTVNI